MGRETKGTVRISIPAEVAFDLKKLNRTIELVAERLGCKTCFSGADCKFQLERDFVFNEKLEFSRASHFATVPDTAPALGATVTVGLGTTTGNNLEKLKGVIGDIAGRLGCDGCCSGFDISFLRERVFLFE